MRDEEDMDGAPAPHKRLTFDQAVEQFRQTFNDEMAKQVNEYDGKQLAKYIVDTLNKDRHAVIWKLLGMDDKWGKWEVDHCNGRESPITRMMAQAVEEEVKQWLVEAIREVVDANRPKLKAEFRSAFKKDFQEKARWYTRDYANKAAMEVIHEIRQEVEKEFKQGVRDANCEASEREGSAGQADQAAR
jgi:hypothetical protein